MLLIVKWISKTNPYNTGVFANSFFAKLFKMCQTLIKLNDLVYSYKVT